MSKTRKDKSEEYFAKYGNIPRDYEERLTWLVEHAKLSSVKMEEIIDKKRQMETSLSYYDFKIVLYEDPEGAKRPRFRLINRKNYMNMAIAASNFVHVYSPNAADDSKFMHRLIDDELIQLNRFIQTPCSVCLNAYFKTPSYFNIVDTILAEIGLHRHIQKPDWDNIGKKYSDMMNENVWLDDNLVIDGEIHKFYSVLPRIEIFVRYLNYVSHPYQYNQIINRADYNPDYPISYIDRQGNPVEG